MKKIKVLHINSLDSYGGAAQVANDLMSATRTENKLLVKFKISDRREVIPLSRISFSDLLFLVIDKIRSLRGIRLSFRVKLGIGDSFNGTYRKLSKIKAYREADIVHLHNIHGGYFDLSALLRIAREKKVVWTLHDMWIMTGGEAYTFDNENYKHGIAKTPYIKFYPLSDPLLDLRSYYMKKKKRIYARLGRALTIVPVSYWLERCLRESYVYNDKLQVQTIHNGINLEIFRNRNQRTWKTPRILFFNLDNPFKGSHLFTGILPDIDWNFELFLVGDKIKDFTPKRHYRFLESRSQLAEVYNEVDILVFPSLAENLALTVMEAMSCGVCVVASDTGGLPEILTAESGDLFESGNAGSLLSKIRTTLQNLGATREKGLAAERRVKEHFDLNACARNYEKLYEALVNEKPPKES